MADPKTQHTANQALDQPLTSREGTVEFLLETPEALQSGLSTDRATYPLLTLPGLAEIEFRAAPSGWDLWWIWETKQPFYHILQGFPTWPAGTYQIQYTWKADEGRLQLFINGTPTRVPEARFELPWTHEDSAEAALLPESPFTVSGLRTAAMYTPASVLQSRVPEAVRGQHADLFLDFPKVENPMQKSSLYLEALYADDLAEKSAVENWVMEGPGVVDHADGWMRMRSSRPDAPAGVNGHFVYWFPQELPDSFVAEWEVQLLNDPGLLIVFFAAQGTAGEDLFDLSLPERNGSFGHYVNGALRCYHISYYSNPSHEPGRTTSNMRKNPPAMMVAQGPVGIEPGSDAVHKVQLIKQGAEVQLSVDDRIAIRWTDDDPERYGAAYGGGYLGFRQMQWMRAQYRNLKIWEIIGEQDSF